MPLLHQGRLDLCITRIRCVEAACSSSTKLEPAALSAAQLKGLESSAVTQRLCPLPHNTSPCSLSSCSTGESSSSSLPPPHTPPRTPGKRLLFYESPTKDVDLPASPFAGVLVDANTGAHPAGEACRGPLRGQLGREQQSFMTALRAREQAARDQLAAQQAARVAAALAGRRGIGGPIPSPHPGPSPGCASLGVGAVAGCAVMGLLSQVLARSAPAVIHRLDRHIRRVGAAQEPVSGPSAQPCAAAAAMLLPCLDRVDRRLHHAAAPGPSATAPSPAAPAAVLGPVPLSAEASLRITQLAMDCTSAAMPLATLAPAMHMPARPRGGFAREGFVCEGFFGDVGVALEAGGTRGSVPPGAAGGGGI